MNKPTQKRTHSEHLCRVPRDSSIARERSHDGDDSANNTANAGVLSRVLAESLKRVDLFAELDDSTRRAIGAVCRSRRYTQGQPVLSQGDGGNDVFFVLEGSVRATLYSVTGREVAFEDLAEGSLFGELSALDNQPRATSIVALEDCSIAVMSSQSFKAMLQTHPGIAWQILERLTALVRRLCDRVFEYSTLDVRQRVQAELFRIALTARANQSDGSTPIDAVDLDQPSQRVSDNSVVISEFPTHAELAARISTHREAVTREINALDRAGIVAREHGMFEVRDMHALSNMVQALQP